MTLDDVISLAKKGESETLEFKTTSGQLPRVGETLCGFLNGRGGCVLIGVRSDGAVLGQAVSDGTLQDIANVLRRFEPPAPVQIERVPVYEGREVIALQVSDDLKAIPSPTTGGHIAESARQRASCLKRRTGNFSWIGHTLSSVGKTHLAS
jgi:predicted HTH transcriptional regulator